MEILNFIKWRWYKFDSETRNILIAMLIAMSIGTVSALFLSGNVPLIVVAFFMTLITLLCELVLSKIYKEEK